MNSKKIMSSVLLGFLLPLILPTSSPATTNSKPPVIAILDYTGINSSHPELVGRVIHEVCIDDYAPEVPNSPATLAAANAFSCPGNLPIVEGDGVAASQFVDGKTSYNSLISHGTSVASVAVGNTLGISKNAMIVAIRPLVTEHLAMAWVLTNKAKYNISAVVLSIGTDVTDGTEEQLCPADYWAATPGFRSMEQLIADLKAVDVLTFISSGNNGAALAISSPACTQGAISVGASDVLSTSLLAPYSNASVDLGIVAPGTLKVATVSESGFGKAVAWGTSIAAPYAAAVYADMKSKFPELSADQILSAMRTSGTKFSTPYITELISIDIKALDRFLSTGQTIPPLAQTFRANINPPESIKRKITEYKITKQKIIDQMLDKQLNDLLRGMWLKSKTKIAAKKVAISLKRSSSRKIVCLRTDRESFSTPSTRTCPKHTVRVFG